LIKLTIEDARRYDRVNHPGIEMTIRLYNQDCLSAMNEIEPHSVDLILADLPYGTTRNKWDSVIPLPELWAAYDRIAKPTAAIVLTSSQPFTSLLVASNLPMFKHEWIWIKNRGSNFANTVREPMKEHESVLVFSKGKWTYNKQMQERTGGGASRVDYGFNFTTATDNYGSFEGKKDAALPKLRVPSTWQKYNCEVGLHPTQKPVGLHDPNIHQSRRSRSRQYYGLGNNRGSGNHGRSSVYRYGE
jgi:site-specific DNA-methyltransferase (adenine-specific)